MIEKIDKPSGWSASEFGIVNFGDKRLSKRLLESFHIKIDKNCSWYCLNICGIVRAHQSLMDP